MEKLIKFGSYVRINPALSTALADWKTSEVEVSFMLPAGVDDDGEGVLKAASAAAGALGLKNFKVIETWRY
jgi:hypothetical protein